VRAAAIAAAIALVAWGMGRLVAPRLLAAISDVHAYGSAAAVAFIGIFALGVMALVPATVLAVAAGALFGIFPGAVYSFVAGTIGSTCAFLLGRHGARVLVERRLAAMPRFIAVDRAVASHGWRIVLLLRLSPVMPFNVLNYALGLTTISWPRTPGQLAAKRSRSRDRPRPRKIRPTTRCCWPAWRPPSRLLSS
jgi:uncharacterized membrane protein YdjX (TVP38/TMEM64 family)